jgi:hypothetical protein
MKMAASLLMLAVTSCGGEWGSDPKGPNAAMLLLRDDQGHTREFYLGGYNSVADCVDMLMSEVDSAAEHDNEFWTNPSFDYGGVRENGWIRHTVVGARCGRRPSA